MVESDYGTSLRRFDPAKKDTTVAEGTVRLSVDCNGVGKTEVRNSRILCFIFDGNVRVNEM
jgi:hypothetical protein